ncbi:MAG: M23 family metallopeptidase [Bacillota bacterium]|nr:M23 family metallopeptidase [Bacillota bacterium]
MSDLHFFNEKKLKKDKLGFYIAFAVCIIAIGAAAWITYGSVMNYIKPANVPKTSSSDNVQSKLVNTPVSGIIVTPTDTTYPDPTVPPSQSNTLVTTNASTATGIEASTNPSTSPNANTTNNEVSSLIYPIKNGTVLKAFSGDTLVYNKTFNDWEAHTGTDFNAAKDTEVKAMADGKVVSIYKDSLLGETIEINHGNGIIAYYSGLLTDTLVSKGDSVKQGDTIGKVGTVPSESSDASHVHVAVKQNGKWVDLMQLVNSNN